MRKNNKIGILAMAFATGKQSVDREIKRYMGIAPVYVLSVNPNKAELSKLFNTDIKEEPVYITTQEVEGKQIKNLRVEFIVKTDPNVSNGIEFITRIPLFIRGEYYYNKDKTKVQIIDKYARTAWATIEEVKNKAIPMYASGPANIDQDYRPAYRGEEELTNFIKAYLNIDDVMRYVDNKWVMTDNPELCEARLNNIPELFKGNFTEIREAIALQPTNKVKVMFGVKTNENNAQYQAVFNRLFLKNSSRNYNRMERELKTAKDNGAYADTQFLVGELREAKIEATNFNTTPIVDNPFTTETQVSTPVAENAETPWDLPF